VCVSYKNQFFTEKGVREISLRGQRVHEKLVQLYQTA
jgi:hypothetical protein